jgi:radical SAM superfamily enzyme YgiQ (UPF0313 family)
LTSKGVSTGITIDMIAGSRGCPFKCKFCSFSVNPWGVRRQFAPRSVESIVREIEEIDADLVLFVDDVFTHHPERVAEICDQLIAKKIRKHYIVNARLEIARRPDIIKKMEEAGFIALLVGVESAQDKTLKSMGKGFNTEQIRQRFEVLRKSSMVINAYFIAGNIGETRAEMLEIAPFARSLGVDLIHVSRLRNEPYSGVSDLVKNTPGYHINDEGFIYSDDCSAEEIAGIRKQIDREFHSPWHIARVVTKIIRAMNWQVRVKAALTIPVFLGQLVTTQAAHKVQKWMHRRSPAKEARTLPLPPLAGNHAVKRRNAA